MRAEPHRVHKVMSSSAMMMTLVAYATTHVATPTKCTQWYHSTSAPSIELTGIGVKMPMLAFGTGSLAPGATEDAVKQAINLGITHIDTAYDYGNQPDVGRAIAEFNRTSIFVTSKVEPQSNASTAFIQAIKQAQDGLRQLGVAYYDLLLLHNPPHGNTRYCAAMRESWRALETFLAAGNTRSIGVSNFCPSSLECLLSSNAKVVPAVNQILYHLGMTPDPGGIKSFCDAHGIYYCTCKRTRLWMAPTTSC